MKKSTLKNKLDTLCRIVIKLRDDYTCQRCGSPCSGRGCHWSHIYSRKAYSMRWDLLNSLVLCAGCHQWYHSNPLSGREWFEQKFPARLAYWVQLIDNGFGSLVPRNVRRRPVYVKEMLSIYDSLKQKQKDLMEM